MNYFKYIKQVILESINKVKKENRKLNTEELEDLEKIESLVDSIKVKEKEVEFTIPKEELSIIDKLLIVAKKKNYVIFTDNSKDFNLNIWYIRASNPITNLFNDKCIIFWKDRNNIWQYREFICTTLPGLSGLVSPQNKNGTFILKPGQYRGTHRIDLHRRGTSSQHEALCHRRGKMIGWRDNDRDTEYDFDGKIYEDGSGINCHRPSISSERTQRVDLSSLGCLVLNSRKMHDDKTNTFSVDTYMGLCRNSRKNWGEWFSITLIDEEDLKSI